MRKAWLGPILLVAALVHPAAAKEAPLVGSLRDGESVFWDGAEVPGATALPGDDACSLDQCWTYRVKVTEPADLLRVAIDVPMRDDEYELSVTGPHARATDYNLNAYNVEIFVSDPRPGTYLVRVSTTDATESAFRLRAALEDRPAKPKPGTLLPPNLRVLPPFEFGFVAPANPFNGMWPGDDVNPPLGAGPVHPVSCAIDEAAEDGAQKCLRFSSGPTNAGPGGFKIRLDDPDKAVQLIQVAGGGWKEHPAGTWEYHKTHGHNHYTDVLTYRLYEVMDRTTGKLRIAGAGVKSGFCPADQLFADWKSFGQARAFSTWGDCTVDLGLSSGWGDVYRWQRPGQYVDFADNQDGLYVVRAIADVHNWVIETNESDNVAYAFVKIEGDEVTILERGRGTDPWDPKKILATDWRTHQ